MGDATDSMDIRREALSDALGRVGSGDRTALREVYDASSAKLFGVILRIVRSREVAEDVLQDVYIKVWSRAGRFDRERASPITWLCVIARNSAIDEVRRSGRREEDGADRLPDVADDAPHADDWLCRAEDADALRACLDDLQEDQRKPVVIAFFEGLTHSELARRIGVPLGTLKSRIRRALIALRGCLDG